ncbi:MAG: hypothetical protein ACMG6S_23380, partial [Byssovorax sp.]
RILLAPAAEIESGSDLRHYKYSFVYAASSLSGCFHPWGAWAFACIRGEIGALSTSFNQPPTYFSPSHLVLGGVGFRLGGERLLTRKLALRAYVEVMAQPRSGSLVFDHPTTVRVAWPGSVVSGSIGFGPVLYFDTQ